MDWDQFFVTEHSNYRAIQDANKSIKRTRRKMFERIGHDQMQDARLQALEEENDEMKLILIDLINTMVKREAITEQDTREIIGRVAAAKRQVQEETEEDRLAGLQAALEDEEDTDEA